MATFDLCEICCEDKLVLLCGSGGVCDKKICIKCKCNIYGFKCVFCFQEQPRFKIIFEIGDRFNWAWGSGPPGIDAYVKRYNVWSYGCLETPGCKCDYCTGDPGEEFWNEVFEYEMSNP